MYDIIMYIYSNTLRFYIFYVLLCMFRNLVMWVLTMQENQRYKVYVHFMARNFELGQNNISVVLSRTIYLSPL